MQFNRANTEKEFKKNLFSKLKIIVVDKQKYPGELVCHLIINDKKENCFTLLYDKKEKYFYRSNIMNGILNICKEYNIPYIIDKNKQNLGDAYFSIKECYVNFNGYENELS